MEIKGKILFEESQRFRVLWLWVLIISSVLLSIGITLTLGITDKEQSTEAFLVLPFVIVLESAIIYLFRITRLETAITTEGIHYRWKPFQRKGWFIPLYEIDKAEIKDGPSLNYGYNWVPGYGKVHNMGPGKGLQLVLRNGKKIFLGTHDETLLKTAFDRMNVLMRKI
jgi:hypothetical protein